MNSTAIDRYITGDYGNDQFRMVGRPPEQDPREVEQERQAAEYERTRAPEWEDGDE